MARGGAKAERCVLPPQPLPMPGRAPFGIVGGIVGELRGVGACGGRRKRGGGGSGGGDAVVREDGGDRRGHHSKELQQPIMLSRVVKPLAHRGTRRSQCVLVGRGQKGEDRHDGGAHVKQRLSLFLLLFLLIG